MQGVLEDGLDSRAKDGTHNLLRAATRAAAFLDWWTMDSANLCTTDCKTTIELGTTLGIYAGTRQIWPAMVEDAVLAASDADNPDEAEIASLGASIAGSMCSSKSTSASSLVLAAEPYIVNGIPDLEEDTVGFVRMAETMLKVMFAPTKYGEGDCSENEFRNMWAKMMQLGTKHAVKLLENTWEGEWVDGYKEEDWLMVTPGAMTAAELNSMISDAMHCFCDYWTGPGDVFPLIESKITQYKANEPEDWGEEFAEAGQLAMRSAKSCKSMSCRGLFDSLFALVEQLSGVSLARGITFNNQPACNAVHADKCWRGECWPINQEGYYPSQCAMCYTPTEPSSTLYPMAHMDDFADRIMFWSTCSMSTDCPPVGVSSYQVTTTFALSIAAADFGADAQADFKKNIVEMLAPQGSDNEGFIAVSDITLTITESGNGRRLTGNGIEVQVTVDVYSESAKTIFTGALESLTPSSATSKLGVTVTGVGVVSITSVAFSPPAPPPSGGEDDGEDDGMSAGVLAGIVVGAVGGLCCCGLVGFLAFFLYKKQEFKMTTSTTTKSSTTPATSEPAMAVVQGTTLSGVEVDTNFKHTLAMDVEIIKRELRLNGTVSEVINEAATQLGINSKGRPLPDVSMECVRALGVVG